MDTRDIPITKEDYIPILNQGGRVEKISNNQKEIYKL